MLKKIKYDCEAIGIRPTLKNILIEYIKNRGFKAVLLYRISFFFYKKNMKIIAAVFKQRNIKLNGCEIGYQAQIGKGFVIGHPVGIVISGDSNIGENFIIKQNCTIGNKDGGAPTIGDNCNMGAGAIVLGDVKIANYTQIGANAVVVKNIINENSVVAGIPAKVIKR